MDRVVWLVLVELVESGVDGRPLAGADRAPTRLPITMTLTPEERAKLANTLTNWGVPTQTILDTLDNAAFGPGVIGMQPDQPDSAYAVGILVNEQRDTELAELFDRRRALDDQAFIADWELAPTRAWALLCPHAPEALLAYNIALNRPFPLRRTFLLLVAKQAHILALLQQPGTSLWLVPHHVAIREWANEGTGTGYDTWGESLPLGLVPAPIPSVQLALQHISHPPGNPRRKPRLPSSAWVSGPKSIATSNGIELASARTTATATYRPSHKCSCWSVCSNVSISEPRDPYEDLRAER